VHERAEALQATGGTVAFTVAPHCPPLAASSPTLHELVPPGFGVGIVEQLP
jgi:hypothetical protein